MHELDALIESVTGPRASSVVITGEPGTGKSWLLAHLLDELGAAGDGPVVLTASGHAEESHLPFAALHQLVAPVLGGIDELPEPQRLALERALALEVATAHEQFAVSLGVKALLEAAARDGRVVLAVDDLHRIDEPSRQVLLFLARRLAGGNVSLVCATRASGGAGDATDAFDRRITLATLDDTQSRDVLRQYYPDLGTIATSRVLELARGLPLALVQLPAELDPPQRRDEEPLPEVLPVGDRIKRLYAGRLAALDSQAIMAALAVCLAPLRRRELDDALALMGLAPTGLDEPQRLGLIEFRGERFEPSHPTLAPVLIRRATHAQLVAVHQALATVFADDIERLALHVWAEERAETERVCAVLDAAAQSASARFAYPEAAAFWERAITAASDSRSPLGARPASPDSLGARVLGWQAAAFEAYTRSGARAPALRLVEAMMTSSDDPVQLARWQIDRLRLGFWTDAHRLLDERTVEIAAAAAVHDPDVAAELIVTHALELAVFGEFHAGADVLERARAAGAIEASAPDEATGLIDELIRVMRADDAEVDVSTWRERMLRAEAGAASGAFPMITLMLAWLGRTDDALALGDYFGELATRMNVVGPRTTTLAIEAVVATVDGRWDAADARYTDCVNLCIDTGILGPVAYMRLRHAWLLAARGASAEALALCELAVPDAERTTPLFLHLMLCVRGLALLSAGAVAESIDVLTEASALEERTGIVQPGYSSRFGDWFEARWRSRNADATELRTELARFEARIHAPGNPANAIALRCAALLADAGAGELDTAFTAAITAHDEGLDPYQGARTRLLYGMRLRRERRKADARMPLREAAETFDALGAFGWAAQARSELAACGERRRATTPGDPLADLTLRENEIARLTASGLTSAAAAARLSVSVRTVDSHLASIYRKLGVPGRAALVELVEP